MNINNDVKDLSTNNYGEISKNIEIIDMADPEFIFNPSYQ